MAGLLGDVLPWAFSQGDRLKRNLNGLLADPAGTLTQAVNNANDRAGGLLAQTQAAATERGYGPASQALAGVLASSYNPVGMTKMTPPSWLEELQGIGGKLNADGTVTVFHRTTPEAAAAIKNTGRMTGNEDGLFFSSTPDGPNSAAYGQGVVKMNVPASKLQLDDLFDTEAHFRLPLRRAGDSLDVRQWLAD